MSTSGMCHQSNENADFKNIQRLSNILNMLLTYTYSNIFNTSPLIQKKILKYSDMRNQRP